MRILLINGSSRSDGLNGAVLRAVRDDLPRDAVVETLDLFAFPLFDPGAEAPQAVQAEREKVRLADRVVVSTPEYNYGIPGPLKNALDWLSRPAYKSVFAGKPVAVLSASPSPVGGARVQLALQTVLGGMVANVHPSPAVTIGGPLAARDEEGNLASDEARSRISRLVRGFIG